MISEQGIVEKIHKNNATIKVMRSSACKHCSSKDACNVSDKNVLIEVKNSLNAKEGDQVEVSVPEGTFIKLSLMVYMFPIFALLAGAFLGNYLSALWHTDQSATAAITGALFLIASFLCLKLYDKKKNIGDKYSPRMTRIIISGRNLPSGDNI